MFTVLTRVLGSSTRGNMATSRLATAPRGLITPPTEASPKPAYLVVSRMLQVIAAVNNLSLTSDLSLQHKLNSHSLCIATV